MPLNPKAPCSFLAHTWAVKRLAYHNIGVYVYTIKLHGVFGEVSAADVSITIRSVTLPARLDRLTVDCAVGLEVLSEHKGSSCSALTLRL